MNKRTGKYLIVFLLLIFGLGLAQEKNSTVYHYDGVPDSSQLKVWMDRNPLNFKKKVNFIEAQFDSLADFGLVQFDSLADFGGAQFPSRAVFRKAQFHSLADFRWAKFDSLADFEWAQFHSLADFGGAQFHSGADFGWAQFDSEADFREAKFHSLANFEGARFNSRADFRGANVDSIIDFSLALIRDTVFVGIRNSGELQKYDFMRAKLGAKSAKIVLCGPVDLKIQKEKFRNIIIWDKLDYFSKRDIISTLKDVSFKEDKYQKERFELDYIFDKSIMYQVRSFDYGEHKWYQFQLWPKWIIKGFLYNITMGLGYRPFWLVYWVIGFIILFTGIYYFWIPKQINKYLTKGEEKKDKRAANYRFFDTIINCFYFSSLLFFTFRLKKDILNFFGTKEKGVIVLEWFIGLLIYISFLTFSKSGSILHTLRSLFVG